MSKKNTAEKPLAAEGDQYTDLCVECSEEHIWIVTKVPDDNQELLFPAGDGLYWRPILTDHEKGGWFCKDCGAKAPDGLTPGNGLAEGEFEWRPEYRFRAALR
jgi:hypothetical protein